MGFKWSKANVYPTWQGEDDAVGRIAVLALVALAFGMRLYHLDFQSLWRDEVDALIFATRDLRILLENFTKIGENGPLYFLLLRYWIAATGTSELALRFFSLIFGVLTVPLAHSFGRWLFDREVGIFAALLVALSPYYVWYSQEAKMYTLFTFVSLLSIYLFLISMKRQRTSLWIAYVLVTSLSLYIHIFSVLVVLLEGFLFIACNIIAFIRRIRFLIKRPHNVASFKPWAIIAFGMLTLPYLPLASWQIPTLLNPPRTSYPFLDLDSIISALVLSWSFGMASSSLPALVFFIFLLLVGLLLYPWCKPANELPESSVILLSYLMFPILAFYLISLRLPLFTDRYLIIASPAYYLLIASGLAALRRRSLLILCLGVLFLLETVASSLWEQSHTQIKPDFRSAARRYAELSGGREPVLFVMPYVQMAFSYYYRSSLTIRRAPYANEAVMDWVSAQLKRELASDGVVWLLLSEEELYDRYGLIKAWLDCHAQLLDAAFFRGIKLYRYALWTSPSSK